MYIHTFYLDIKISVATQKICTCTLLKRLKPLGTGVTLSPAHIIVYSYKDTKCLHLKDFLSKTCVLLCLVTVH